MNHGFLLGGAWWACDILSCSPLLVISYTFTSVMLVTSSTFPSMMFISCLFTAVTVTSYTVSSAMCISCLFTTVSYKLYLFFCDVYWRHGLNTNSTVFDAHTQEILVWMNGLMENRSGDFTLFHYVKLCLRGKFHGPLDKQGLCAGWLEIVRVPQMTLWL